MRESRTYGSGRGARGNSRPYRERGGNAGAIGAAAWPVATLAYPRGMVAINAGCGDYSLSLLPERRVAGDLTPRLDAQRRRQN